ncbi:hypothetical protein ABPG72_004758 [Tetrahymena utriculariae]
MEFQPIRYFSISILDGSLDLFVKNIGYWSSCSIWTSRYPWYCCFRRYTSQHCKIMNYKMSWKVSFKFQQVIAAIPDKVMISQYHIKEGELKEMLQSEKNAHLFNEKQAGDAEFNILTAFLIYERLKKNGESFYQPYFDTIERSYTLYDWEEKDIIQTECPELIDEFKHYKEDVEVTWIQLKECLVQYPQFYDKEKLTRELFFWCYELVMTRVFGHFLPYTCLVPFGDLFNHGNHSATHYIVNKYFEAEESIAHPQYKIKKNKIDLSIFDTNNSGKFQASNNNDFHYRCQRFRFVKDHYKVLCPNLRSLIEDKKFIEDDILRSMVYEINTKELFANVEVNIWDLKFFTTSATEDNDTDEEQTEGRKKEYDNLFHKELKIVENNQKRGRKNVNTLNIHQSKNESISESNTTQSSSKGTTGFEQILSRTKKNEENESSSDSGFQENDYESGDDSSYEDSEEEEEESDDEEQENQDKKGKQIKDEDITTKLNAGNEVGEKDKTTDPTINITNIEKIKDVKKQKEPKNSKLKIEHTKYEYNLDSVSTLSDDTEFKWYQSQTENTYFAVTTEQAYKKGEQIFLCYGRRTNKFLLQWYGFAFQNNLFDSFGFRMWIQPEPCPLEIPKIFNQIIFRKFISEDDWKNGFVMNDNIKISTKDLTKEFRLKRGHLCDGRQKFHIQTSNNIYLFNQLKKEFIIYLRIYLSSHYHGKDQQRILFTLPQSFGFEKFVFDFALKVLKYMREQYKTTNQEDEALLKDYTITYKQRFAIVLRLDHKKMLDEQIQIINSIYKILCSLESKDFQQKSRLQELQQQQQQQQQQQNTDNKENQETQTTPDQSNLSEKNQNNAPLKKEIIITDDDISFRQVYLENVEEFKNNCDLVIERHKIKKYLEKLYLGIYKNYIL